jgi:hypothetical protein
MNSAALFVCQGFVECQKATKEKPLYKGRCTILQKSQNT